jgi:hypothetical protein
MICIYRFLFIIFLCFSFKLNSQVNSHQSIADTTLLDSIVDDRYNETKFSIQTGNNIVQVGQVMSTNQFYLRPAVSFYHKSGIYLGGNLTLMPTDTQRVLDNISLSLGYDKELKNNFTIGLDYTFSHYYSTKQVTSSANHVIRPYISWENKFIVPTLTPSIIIGSNIDYAAQFDLSRIFIIKSVFKKKDKISIPISIGINTGTSEFYSIYNKDKRGPRQPMITDTVAVTRFAITSLYSMMGLKYKIKQTSFSFYTSYYLSRDVYNRTMILSPLILRFTLAYYL